tara:strand:- start:383 stop:1060 length:678 start_codon:yes stop_codon:yes gene_type:complete
MQHNLRNHSSNDTGCAADVCGLKYVSHQHKFIYFEVPKTGTSSLLALLRQHLELETMKGRYDFLNHADYIRFAFVRNPWDRILSCYLNKIKQDKNFQSKHFTDGVMKKFHRFNAFYAGMPFTEFLRAVAGIPDCDADGHFASQYTRLVQNKELVVTHLARFENYQREVKHFLKMIGIEGDIELPHLNRTMKRMPYSGYYNAETIRLVEERYGEDIQRFEYHFGGE